MTQPVNITFSEVELPDGGAVIVLCEAGLSLSKSARDLDKKNKGLLVRSADIANFNGKRKSSMTLLAPEGLSLSWLTVVGMGDPDKFGEKDWLELGGYIRSQMNGRNVDTATVVLDRPAGKNAVDPENVATFALGLALRGYEFKKYKTKKKKKKDDETESKTLKKIVVQCRDAKVAKRVFKSREAICGGVFLARDLVNEPANILGPEEFAEEAKKLKKDGLKVEVLNEKALGEKGMEAFLAVGQGSEKQSCVVVMQWQGSARKSEKPVAFIGKGVTFDTGGISIKPAQGMGDMKGDMGGAACVTGLMKALAGRKAKVNAVGVIGLTENMPDGKAIRPGDVVKSMSGQTIEILNTDAEGRLVLADTLWYTQSRFKPKFMINLATLTGAIVVALAKEYAGLFSNSDELVEKLMREGEATGERVWRLPLGGKYDKMIDSKVADMKNIGGRWGGSITAAQFLQRFVNDVDWAHIDIAGTAMGSPTTEINRSWGSGYGVRLLDRLVAEHYEDKPRSG